MTRPDSGDTPQAPKLPALPLPLEWRIAPEAWSVDGDVFRIRSQARVDLFTDPAGSEDLDTSPRALMPVDGDFRLSARVEVEFGADFDAGVLLLWAGRRTWAKLCFEYSPQAVGTVVSVVTHDVSDDANAFSADGRVAWLRVSRKGRACAFHASRDGRAWQFVRHFRLEPDATHAGFMAQSPSGPGCTVRFSEIHFDREPPADLRDGS